MAAGYGTGERAGRRERTAAMGDKRGKKNKDKSQKQKMQKNREEAQRKEDKQRKPVP